MPERSVSNTYILCKACNLGTLDSTSALCLSTILNSDIINKKYKNMKNMALNRLQKGYLFTV